jgi:hypothetical protein
MASENPQQKPQENPKASTASSTAAPGGMSADMNALAAEVMDLWQEHLATYASDPAARDELTRMLEPQRQLFADWTSLMQNGIHGAPTAQTNRAERSDTANPSKPAPQPAHGATPAATPSDDGALRVAQLALRMAELEKRMANLESSLLPKNQRRSKAH